MSYVTQDKYARKSGMVASILLNGAIIGAVMLSPMVVERIKNPPPLTIINVKQPSPPPVVETPPEPVTEPLQVAPIFVPDPIFAPPVDLPPVLTTADIAIDTGPVGGTMGNGDTVSSDLPPAPFRAAVRDSRHAGAFQPDYPLRLLQRGVEGTVKVRVLIGIDGRVRQVVILEASQPEFGRATEKKALSSWRFIPATRGREKVEDWQVLTVRFTINE